MNFMFLDFVFPYGLKVLKSYLRYILKISICFNLSSYENDNYVFEQFMYLVIACVPKFSRDPNHFGILSWTQLSFLGLIL